MSVGDMLARVARASRPRAYALRLAGALAVAVQIGYLMDGATRPGFDPWVHQISHLSLGECGWLGITNLVAASLSVSLAAVALGFERTGKSWRRIPGWLVVPAVGLLAAAAFPTDPGQGYPPGVAATRTWVGAVHDVGGLLVFGGFTAALIVAARRLRRDEGWGLWARVSLGCALVVPISWAAGAALTGLAYADTWPGSPAGLCERISLGAALLWLAVTCWLSAGHLSGEQHHAMAMHREANL